ncbi:hypothetical protein [Photobacterium sp.]|uniref:hypothetical protein n=1 Tax=Photobacterium sp. TaxID=660 RepID=UPI00299EF3E3|nr:hypothetical protein [Photobacterium sp.]MDX1303655.1 hypothetical protein [Photobacterium sp.]
MLSTIYITTWSNGFFGSAGQSWLSIDVEKIVEQLSILGRKVEVITYRDLLNVQLSQKDIVIYCSSDELNMRAYLKDLMFFIDKKCTLIPSYTALLAHENKGFQQLMREDMSFGNLAGDYAFDFDELKREKPYVFKKVTGAGSSGVTLVKSNKDEKVIKSKQFEVGFKRKLIKKQRALKLTTNEFDIYNYRYKGFSLAVTQDFIKGLTCDYKVLAFGSKFFVLRRDVRKNDFRASGSGKFKFDEVPSIVLAFAKQIFETLNEPYASLDIAISENEAYLIEYQILNFGPYTLNNSPGHYEYRDEWLYVNEKSNLDECFSEALYQYVEKKVFEKKRRQA